MHYQCQCDMEGTICFSGKHELAFLFIIHHTQALAALFLLPQWPSLVLTSPRRGQVPLQHHRKSLLTLFETVSVTGLVPPLPSRGEKKRVPRPNAQLRDDLETAAVSGVAARRHKESPRFLFVPYPDVQDIDEETHLAINASNISDRFLARYPMYNAENMAMIQRELGKGFATYGMTCTKPYVALPIVHQGVATFQHLSHSFNRDVTFRSWDWLLAQLKMVNTRPKRSPAAKRQDSQPTPARRSKTPSSPTHKSPA